MSRLEQSGADRLPSRPSLHGTGLCLLRIRVFQALLQHLDLPLQVGRMLRQVLEQVRLVLNHLEYMHVCLRKSPERQADTHARPEGDSNSSKRTLWELSSSMTAE